jgi:hypothetical protein
MSAAIWSHLRHDGTTLWDVGRRPDGSLYNPHGYPEETVRAALAAAEERLRERRSASAKQAAETRRKRTDRRVYEVAQRIVDGHVFGPRNHCYICGRGLDDPNSIARGIGSECWQDVLQQHAD